MAAQLRDAVYVDGVRVPIGRARPDGYYGATRADDMAVRTIRALLERNGGLDPARVDDNAWAATAQVGDQGLTLGRSTAVLAGLPKSVPGYAVDRMCAGALTTITNAANAIRVGAQDVVIAGGVEHMGHHPMGEEVDPNPRFVAESLVDSSALVMGATAENLHDELPGVTRARCDEYALQSQERVAKAQADGVFDDHVVPMTVWQAPSDDAEGPGGGWRVVTQDEHPRPGTTLEDLAALPTPFRPGGRITAGNAAGLNDGAGCALLTSREAADEMGLAPTMRLVDYAFVGVEPETMGYGPVPATEQVLARAGLTIDDIDLVEMNEAFAVQCVAFLDHFGLPLDSPKVNPYGGAIALGHPLAMSGARLSMQLAHAFRAQPEARYGITTLCIGMGMGCTVLWERC
ncbi:thiolase family protein [Egibacter rhizosphaerae]|uniref:Thiolase family protein n=1 Tax=Egibacter rhizosphaerae TaxID=1670831 RepID=A0A411YIJ9_9ACTN|nr:thiolase family protein [Egibacter rhizosphaerae]QBI21135.1 thiolase family protein [Egibacter rhizosphaerae]